MIEKNENVIGISFPDNEIKAGTERQFIWYVNSIQPEKDILLSLEEINIQKPAVTSRIKNKLLLFD